MKQRFYKGDRVRYDGLEGYEGTVVDAAPNQFTHVKFDDDVVNADLIMAANDDLESYRHYYPDDPVPVLDSFLEKAGDTMSINEDTIIVFQHRCPECTDFFVEPAKQYKDPAVIAKGVFHERENVLVQTVGNLSCQSCFDEREKTEEERMAEMRASQLASAKAEVIKAQARVERLEQGRS